MPLIEWEFRSTKDVQITRLQFEGRPQAVPINSGQTGSINIPIGGKLDIDIFCEGNPNSPYRLTVKVDGRLIYQNTNSDVIKGNITNSGKGGSNDQYDYI